MHAADEMDVIASLDRAAVADERMTQFNNDVSDVHMLQQLTETR